MQLQSSKNRFKVITFHLSSYQPQVSSAQFNGEMHCFLHLMRPCLIRDSGGIWNHKSNEIQSLGSWFIRQQDFNPKRKRKNLLDFFHLFFKMLENGLLSFNYQTNKFHNNFDFKIIFISVMYSDPTLHLS